MIVSKLFQLLENVNYLSLIGIVLTIYVTQYYYKYFTRVNPLPGPFPFPLFGNLPQLYILHGRNAKKFFESNHKNYGDIIEVQMGGRLISLGRTEYYENFSSVSTKDPHIMKMAGSSKEGYKEIGMMGKGLLFNQDLKSWRYNRHFFTQAILSPKFSHEAINCANKLFIELEGYWKKLYLGEGINKKNENKLNFSTWLNQFTNDMIIALLTGERSYTMAGYFNSLSDNEKADRPSAIIDETVKLVHAIRKVVLGLSFFSFTPTFLRHYVPYFKNKSNDFVQNINFVNQRADEIIRRRRQEIENTPLDKPLPNDILTSIIIANTARDTSTNGNREMSPMTDTEIRGLMFDGIIAGTDTTANTISFIVYYLAHHPDVKKKMLEEIDGIFQGDKTRPITEDDFNKLKYCKAIVNEVSRVFAVVNGIPRVLDKTEEVAGYQWPAGTMFRIAIDAVQNSKDYWKEPDKFNPDRWMDEGFEPKKHSFIMFGVGLRICPGRKLALIELVCLMALLFRKYEINLVDMEAPLKTESFALTTCTELSVDIKLRN